MEEGKFDALAMREELTPKLTRAEMARKLGVSYQFLTYMEEGRVKWPQVRKEKFIEICESWRVAPSPAPRKPRKDIGKRHRKFKRRGKPRLSKQPQVTSHEIQTSGSI